MDGPRDYLPSEDTHINTNTIRYNLHVESKKKMMQIKFFLQNRNRRTDLDNQLMVTKGERWRGIN